VINFIKGAKKYSDFPSSSNEVIFIGKSNVGKSTLINALYKNNLAYTGKTPGKTRMLNFFNINDSYTICDAPGYGFAKRNDNELIEYGNMMEDYFNLRGAHCLSILILDIRHDPSNDDLEMIDYLNNTQKPYLIVLNKSDKLSNNQKANQVFKFMKILELTKDQIITISAFKKIGTKELRETIEKYILK